MHFNWCATAIGVLHEKLSRPIDGTDVHVGDTIISLQSCCGFRSNGFSLLRKTMTEQFGDNWHTAKYNETTTWGKMLLTPSRIFSPVICQLLDSDFHLKGIAHITGGGIKGNLERVLKVNNLGAVLDQLFEPLEVMKKMQELGNISSEIAYKYWNMGNGMLIVVAKSETEAILQKIKEASYEAKVAGKVVAEQRIQIN
jgi:phosphoribosylformylglycinamidine cyclo-ligase